MKKKALVAIGTIFVVGLRLSRDRSCDSLQPVRAAASAGTADRTLHSDTGVEEADFRSSGRAPRDLPSELPADYGPEIVVVEKEPEPESPFARLGAGALNAVDPTSREEAVRQLCDGENVTVEPGRVLRVERRGRPSGCPDPRPQQKLHE